VADLKRPHSPSPGVELQPLPMRPLPISLWEDHLLPLLTPREAARLGCTCKGLRGVVREHFKDVGMIDLKTLPAALTTFPRARTVKLRRAYENCGNEEMDALLRWLREEGRGGHLEAVRVRDDEEFDDASDTVHAALREGALPSLKSVDVHVKEEAARASLMGGFLGSMHELRVTSIAVTPLRSQRWAWCGSCPP
jgi:hypothetical protein